MWKKNRQIILIGGLLGSCIPVLFGTLAVTFQGSEFRNILLEPFFAVSWPIFYFGEQFFGQAPTPIFILLFLYWVCIGLTVGLVVGWCKKIT